MKTKTSENPFRNTRPPVRRITSPFSVRMEGPRTPSEIAIAKTQREKRQNINGDIEHLPSVTDLHAYLEQHGHADACAHAYSCDPWKYEPIMCQDLGLMLGKLSEEYDHTKRENLEYEINELRGLIRAGSWMTYERPDLPKDLQTYEKLLKHAGHTFIYEIEARLRSINLQINDPAIRRSDPTWVKELETEKKDLLRLMEATPKIADDLKRGITGDTLERSVRTFDAIYNTLLLEMQKLLAAGGTTSEDPTLQKQTRDLRGEVVILRPIRDLLYYRRLYPKQAARAITPNI